MRKVGSPKKLADLIHNGWYKDNNYGDSQIAYLCMCNNVTSHVYCTDNWPVFGSQQQIKMVCTCVCHVYITLGIKLVHRSGRVSFIL